MDLDWASCLVHNMFVSMFESQQGVFVCLWPGMRSCAGAGLAWLSRSQILYRDKVSKLMYCGDELRQIWRSRNAGLFIRQSPLTLPGPISCNSMMIQRTMAYDWSTQAPKPTLPITYLARYRPLIKYNACKKEGLKRKQGTLHYQ